MEDQIDGGRMSEQYESDFRNMRTAYADIATLKTGLNGLLDSATSLVASANTNYVCYAQQLTGVVGSLQRIKQRVISDENKSNCG